MNKKKEDDGLARQVPALAAYYERIGAEELNFRRAMVKEYRGGHYYVERTLVKISNEGEVTVSRKEHEPTKDEAEAIKAAILKIDFPKSIGASEAQVKKLARGIKGDLYSFVSRRDGLATMCQQRLAKEDGTKAYIPWTYWSDGKWRAMEPDGPLPFWKPRESRNKKMYMVHEGAKAAQFIDELVNSRAEELEAHPWGEELKLYEHWGMIGGALAPHRADFDELKREKSKIVVYVADHDFAGQAAIQEVSYHFGQAMRSIEFPDHFPVSWDMADPMPINLFSKVGRYLGPPLAELVKPATWATELVPTGEKGRPTTVLRRPFREEWLHSIEPEVYIHRDWAHKIYAADKFNNLVKPFSHVDDTARLIRGDNASKSAALKYSPADPVGVFSSPDASKFINTHRPTTIKPEKGDVFPFMDFMTHLVVDQDDRMELMRWCATLIAKPETRMLYGVLLISEVQGVGKGTLGEKVLAPLVGEENVSYPSEESIVDGTFNYWASHKRLAIVHEIYAGHSSRAYNRLKSIMTDKGIQVKKKYQDEYTIDNWLHIFACSNSMRAIHMSADDRRWFVPKITDEKQDPEYWAAFNYWLNEEGGLAKIHWWAKEFCKKNLPVMIGDNAPNSSLKKDIVEEGYSQGQLLISSTLERVEEVLASDDEDDIKLMKRWEDNRMLVDGSVILIDTQLVELIKEEVHQGRPTDRLEKPMTLRKLAKSKGWWCGSQKVSTGMKTWGVSARNGRVISNVKAVAEASPADLGGKKSDRKQVPLDLEFMRIV